MAVLTRLFKFVARTVKRILYLVLIVIGLYLAYCVYVLISRCPTIHPVSADDPLWTSEVYLNNFESRDRYSLIESFQLEEYLYVEDVNWEVEKWVKVPLGDGNERRDELRNATKVGSGSVDGVGNGKAEEVVIDEGEDVEFIDDERGRFDELILGLYWKAISGENEKGEPIPVLLCNFHLE